MRWPPLTAVVFGEKLESPPMTAQDGRKCPSKGTIVETALDGLKDNLVTDQSEPNFAPLLHVHRLREVPGDENAQTAADPLHTPSERHDGSLMCV